MDLDFASAESVLEYDTGGERKSDERKRRRRKDEGEAAAATAGVDFKRSMQRLIKIAKPFWFPKPEQNFLVNPIYIDFESPLHPVPNSVNSDSSSPATRSSSAAASEEPAKLDISLTNLSSPLPSIMKVNASDSSSAYSAKLQKASRFNFSLSSFTSTFHRLFFHFPKQLLSLFYLHLIQNDDLTPLQPSSSSPSFYSSPSQAPSQDAFLLVWLLTFLLAALLLASTYFHVVVSNYQKEMSTAMSNKDLTKFYSLVLTYAATTIFTSLLFSMSHYARNKISLIWRHSLTVLILNYYFKQNSFYKLQHCLNSNAGVAKVEPSGRNDAQTKVAATNVAASEIREHADQDSGQQDPTRAQVSILVEPSIPYLSAPFLDNPDQRIQEDIKSVTQSFITLVHELVDHALEIAAFSSVLFRISPFLTFSLLVYGFLGTYFMSLLYGARLIAINKQLSQNEANFRFELIRIRENSESIAISRGHRLELSTLYNRFVLVYNNLLRWLLIKRNLGVFRNLFRFLSYIMPSLLVAPYFFRGEVEFGVIAQSGIAFRTIFQSLNMFTMRLNEFSALAVGVDRLWLMIQLMEVKEILGETQMQDNSNVQEQVRGTNSRCLLLLRVCSQVADSVLGGLKRKTFDFVNKLRQGASQLFAQAHLATAKNSSLKEYEESEPFILPSTGRTSASASTSSRTFPAVPPCRILNENRIQYITAPELRLEEVNLALPSNSALVATPVAVESEELKSGAATADKAGSKKLARSFSQGKLNGERNEKEAAQLHSLPSPSAFVPSTRYLVRDLTLLLPNDGVSHLLIMGKSGFGNPNMQFRSCHTEFGSAIIHFGCKTHNLCVVRVLLSSIFFSGKTSLFRAISGLFHLKCSGRVYKPAPADCLFLPQKPYFCSGNLRQQMIYPLDQAQFERRRFDADLLFIQELAANTRDLGAGLSVQHSVSASVSALNSPSASAAAQLPPSPSPSPSSVCDEYLYQILRLLNLHSLIGRFDLDLNSEFDWSSLSAGEQQRLALSRLFVQKPRLAFLDESTAALDLDNELRFYSLLKSFAIRSQANFVSIGHRASLKQFHSHLLTLMENGDWKLEKINRGTTGGGNDFE